MDSLNLTDILEGGGTISVCIYQKTGKVVAINWDVLESVGPGHDIDGIE